MSSPSRGTEHVLTGTQTHTQCHSSMLFSPKANAAYVFGKGGGGGYSIVTNGFEGPKLGSIMDCKVLQLTLHEHNNMERGRVGVSS